MFYSATLDSPYVLFFYWNLPEDDDENPEFVALVENFRSEATKLLDMLDVSSPVVARLKVDSKQALPFVCLYIQKPILTLPCIFNAHRKC